MAALSRWGPVAGRWATLQPAFPVDRPLHCGSTPENCSIRLETGRQSLFRRLQSLVERRKELLTIPRLLLLTVREHLQYPAISCRPTGAKAGNPVKLVEQAFKLRDFLTDITRVSLGDLRDFAARSFRLIG